MDLNNLIIKSDQAIKNNNFSHAVKLLENAIKIEPNSYDLYLKLGLLNQHLANYDESIKYFKKTISLEPKSVSAFSNLGIIYYKLNKKNLALKNYLKAISLDPENFLGGSMPLNMDSCKSAINSLAKTFPNPLKM